MAVPSPVGDSNAESSIGYLIVPVTLTLKMRLGENLSGENEF